NFPVFCGVPPPRTIVAEVEWVAPGVSPDDVALANFYFLNEARRIRGLPELQWDARAAAVAATHGRDMIAHGFFGHHSPRTGDVQARFERAGIKATVVRENVARGYGPAGIHHSLMHSPGHRVNILATDVTHVGVGVVIGDPESDGDGAPRPVFLTQNFFKPPGAGAPAAERMVPTLVERVDARRREQRLPQIHWDERLDAVAARIADSHARGRGTPRGFEKDVFALGYAGVDTHIVGSGDFDALATVALWGQLLGPTGVGIARKADGFVLVVLVAEH
ncbi:MAG TPA: CAP domain-containing protein, partial [Nannocystaceae bacterium]|nr:CAP domain-containing protein [Nannocystaceae bacterium]